MLGAEDCTMRPKLTRNEAAQVLRSTYIFGALDFPQSSAWLRSASSAFMVEGSTSGIRVTQETD